MKKALLSLAATSLTLFASDARADSQYIGELLNVTSYTSASDTQSHDGSLTHRVVDNGTVTRVIRFGGTMCPVSLSTTQLQTLTTAMIHGRTVVVYTKPGNGTSFCLVGFGIS